MTAASEAEPGGEPAALPAAQSQPPPRGQQAAAEARPSATEARPAELSGESAVSAYGAEVPAGLQAVDTAAAGSDEAAGVGGADDWAVDGSSGTNGGTRKAHVSYRQVGPGLQRVAVTGLQRMQRLGCQQGSKLQNVGRRQLPFATITPAPKHRAQLHAASCAARGPACKSSSILRRLCDAKPPSPDS